MLLYNGIILAVIIGLFKSRLCDDNNTHFSNADSGQNACDTLACRELARNIQHNMNKSMDPCIDFLEYGCGNWKKNKTADQLTWDPIQYKIYRRVHELLVEENKYDKIPFIKIAKQFYRSCINEDAIENEGLKSIKSLLNSTGGWPILMSNEEWYQENYKWQDIDNFYHRFYGFSSFFKLQYLRVDPNETHVVLEDRFPSYPFDETLENDTYHNMYINFMIKVVQAFAADERVLIPEKKLLADIKAVLNFYANLKKIVKYRKQEPWQKEIETIVELQEFYDLAGTQNSTAKIHWLDMIQTIFKDLNIGINASQLVRVPNRQFLHQLAHLLDTTESHVIVNYIQWNIVTQFMQYLNKRIRNIEIEYYPRYDAIGKEERWLTCVKNFPMNDVASYIFNKRYTSTDTLNAASNMINKIKTVLKRKISHIHWMRYNIKHAMMYKIDKMSLEIDYPKWYDNRTNLFNLYEKLKIGDNYFENWLAFKKFKAERSLLNIYREINIRKSTDNWPIYLKQKNSLYHEGHNIMVIPTALIQDPYFTSDTPPAVNYGAIGSIIAYEFLRNILLDKIRISGSDALEKITEAEEIANIRERSICLYEQYINLTLGIRDENSESNEDKREILEDIVIEFTAIQVAFTAFQEMIKAKPLHGLKLTTLTNVTDEQLFFLSFVNIMCTSARKHSIGDIDHISVYNPKKYVINVILANMEYFSAAFKCPVNSPLNRESKCIFWE